MVYFATDGSYIKIGYTTQSLSKRIKQLNTGNSKKIISLGWIEGNKDKEQQLHKEFGNCRVRYNSEWFLPDQKLLDFINKNNLEITSYVDIIDNQIYKLFKLIKI